MHRWLFRRQRKLLFFASILLVIIILWTLTFHVDIPIRHHSDADESRCRDPAATQVISKTCGNFSSGSAYGDLCSELCPSSQLVITGCIHTESTDVLFVRQRENKIILKQKYDEDTQGIVEKFRDYRSFHNRPEAVRTFFNELMLNEVEAVFGRGSFPSVDDITFSVFNKPVRDLTMEQLETSLHLITQQEWLVLFFFKDLYHLPDYLGSCGSLYSLEDTNSYRLLFPESVPHILWSERIFLGYQFLQLVIELETRRSPSSLLYCDWQEANFGLTSARSEDDLLDRDEDVQATQSVGSYRQLKIIDLSKLYTKDVLRRIFNEMTCKTDSDCWLTDCSATCDLNTQKCSGPFTSSNLQLMCRDILLTKWPTSGLLGRYVPSHLARSVDTLLKECTADSFAQLPWTHPIVENMVKDLTEVFDPKD